MGWEFLTQLATTLDSKNGSDDLESMLASWSIRIVGVCSLLVVILLLYSSRQKRMKNAKKKALFLSMTSLIVLTTVFLFGSTIYINTISDSKGPVHWHADIEIWACGTEVELREPTGLLSNKIGSATYHEHNDKRIHLEGVVVEESYDASLGKFMYVTGGDISPGSLTIPTNFDYVEGDVDGDSVAGDSAQLRQYVRELDSGYAMELKDGMLCNGVASEVQTYVYSYDKKSDTYSQSKLADPKSYIMRDQSIVPPGDCVIVEFGPKSERTNKLCLQYGVRDKEKCGKFSGTEGGGKLCTMYEKVNTGGQTQ